MSLTSQQLVERAVKKLPQDTLAIRSQLYVSIPDALKSLGNKIAQVLEMADLLRKDFSLTVAAGSASLTTPLTASEPLILQYLGVAKITSADSTFPWQYIADFTLLNLSRPTFGLIYYTIEGTNLQCTDTSGITGSLSTTATVNGSYVPLLSTVSGNSNLESMLVDELVGGNDVPAIA